MKPREQYHLYIEFSNAFFLGFWGTIGCTVALTIWKTNEKVVLEHPWASLAFMLLLLLGTSFAGCMAKELASLLLGDQNE
jgi:hypothetical protein